MRFALILLFPLLYGIAAAAQTPALPREGTVTYERKENLAFLRKTQVINGAGNENVDFRSLFFELRFNPDKSIYSPIDSNAQQKQLLGLPGADNIVFLDMKTRTTLSSKNVFGNLFLLEKPFTPIKWKLTGETKTIAGFECKRANAIIMDSIYVVAFYTDNIVSGAGPESFSGLPGMILGVVLPHQHISWFATAVNLKNIPAAGITPPTRGSKVTLRELQTILETKVAPLDPRLNEYIYQYLL
jgi:GLPGLI family protein